MRISPLGQGLTYLASREDGPIEHDLFYHSFENGSNGNLTSETIDRPIMSYD
ncbi:MAG: hypothetical protein SFX72_06605 [Isosphaeraceae bacterium]|nr:hypothetical protein [Isosphaeraceae bacterium]